ncbi:hypothetical protein ACPC54_18515 [Kitasatospora sp. NPDC094028]
MPSGELPGMTRELMMVEYPSTTRLSQSTTTPGGRSSLARNDENGLTTHAVLFPADDEIDRIRAEAVRAGYADGAQTGLAVGIAVGAALTLLALAAPHVKSRFADLKARMGRKPEIATEVLPGDVGPAIETPQSENRASATMAE